MEPILVTLVFIPPILLVVTLGHLYWRHASKSPRAAYGIIRLLFWFFVAFGPLSVWLLARLEHPFYLLWGIIAVQWIVGIVRFVPVLRHYRERVEYRV